MSSDEFEEKNQIKKKKDKKTYLSLLESVCQI
jgi:hypothetical protein